MIEGDAKETMSRAEAWKLILQRNCKKELVKLRREYPHCKSLVIPYGEVQRFGSIGCNIADEILDNPGKVCEDIVECIRDNKLVENEKGEGAKDIIPRFINIPRKTAIKDIRERHIGTLLAIEVQVRRVSDILPRCVEAWFRCPAGHFTRKFQGYNTWVVPSGCATDGCTFKKLDYVPARSVNIDTQRVLVQEVVDNAQGGEQPKTISAEFMGDLCGTVFPGDRVIVNAILKSYQVTKNGQPSPVFRTYLEVNNVEIFQREYEEVEITEDEERTIKTLAKEKDILNKIARSIAPSVYGMVGFKQALALSLFSGKQAHNQYGESKRMDVHVLGCGDPALAKSKVARYACRVAPRAVITTGISSTKAGLGVSVSRDDIDGRMVADAGAMPLADGGIIFIDELADLPKPEQAVLHEMMEEQKYSYAKGGLVGSANTRCATWSCMNPKSGRFDQFEDLADQVDIKPALISRFDLVYLMIDKPEKTYDAGVAAAILEDDEPTTDAPVRDDIISVELLRKYIAVSKKLKNPVISPEAKKILSEYYLKVRGEAKDGAPIPITARAMDTLKRLSVAHAKMRLSDTVTIKDAELAVRVLDESLKNVAVDPITGKRDIDRVSGASSSHKRNLSDAVIDTIKLLHTQQGAVRKTDIEAQLIKDKVKYGDNELTRMLDDLTRHGQLSESRGLYSVM